MTSGSVERLPGGAPADVPEVVLSTVRIRLQDVDGEIDLDTPLLDRAGFDSIVITDLIETLEKIYTFEIPPQSIVVSTFSTTRALADVVLRCLLSCKRLTVP